MSVPLIISELRALQRGKPVVLQPSIVWRTRKTPRLAKIEIAYSKGWPTSLRWDTVASGMAHGSEHGGNNGDENEGRSERKQPGWWGCPVRPCCRKFGTDSDVPSSSIPSLASPPAVTMPGSVSSLDSLHSPSELSYDSDEEWQLAQREWEESLEQLQQLVSIVLLPFLGRYIGRKWSFWGAHAIFVFPAPR